jgi:hypothetical protein
VQHQVDRTGDVHVVGDVAADQPEPGALHQVQHVLRRPGQEVVQADDLHTTVEQVLAQMGTEEAGAAGHHRAPDLPRAAHRTLHRHTCSRPVGPASCSQLPTALPGGLSTTHFGGEVPAAPVDGGGPPLVPPTPTGRRPPGGDRRPVGRPRPGAHPEPARGEGDRVLAQPSAGSSSGMPLAGGVAAFPSNSVISASPMSVSWTGTTSSLLVPVSRLIDMPLVPMWLSAE